MIPLLAYLAVAAQAFVLLTVASAGIQRVSGARPFDALVRLIGSDAIRLAFLVALVATAASLYFSQVRHFQPCELCWFQRIAMYPLVLILGAAMITGERRVGRFVLPLIAAGTAVSVYHYQLERFPDQESISCSKEIPCTTIWFEQFGYITMPMLALSAFALIATLVWIGGRHGQGISNEA